MRRSFPVVPGRRAPTAAEYDSAIAALAGSIPGTSEERAGLRAFMARRFPPPRLLPAYQSALTNGDGVLLVVTSPVGAPATEILAFDSAGRSLGGLQIPGDLDVVEAGPEYLLGIVHDSDGNGRVVAYGLEVR